MSGLKQKKLYIRKQKIRHPVLAYLVENENKVFILSKCCVMVAY
jgi:hypothetical protein